MRKGFTTIALIFSLFIFLAFQESEPKTLFEETLEKKLLIYHQQRYEKCKEEAILEAELHVDSIVALLLNPPVSDDTKSPPKPNKPAKPFDTLILDEREVVPILPVEK